jgi:hypothetical protein
MNKIHEMAGGMTPANRTPQQNAINSCMEDVCCKRSIDSLGELEAHRVLERLVNDYGLGINHPRVTVSVVHALRRGAKRFLSELNGDLDSEMTHSKALSKRIDRLRGVRV